MSFGHSGKFNRHQFDEENVGIDGYFDGDDNDGDNINIATKSKVKNNNVGLYMNKTRVFLISSVKNPLVITVFVCVIILSVILYLCIKKTRRFERSVQLMSRSMKSIADGNKYYTSSSPNDIKNKGRENAKKLIDILSGWHVDANHYASDGASIIDNAKFPPIPSRIILNHFQWVVKSIDNDVRESIHSLSSIQKSVSDIDDLSLSSTTKQVHGGGEKETNKTKKRNIINGSTNHSKESSSSVTTKKHLQKKSDKSKISALTERTCQLKSLAISCNNRLSSIESLLPQQLFRWIAGYQSSEMRSKIDLVSRSCDEIMSTLSTL